MAIYAPDHRVTIKRAATGYQPEDISLDILAISINKGYAKAAGGFQITMTFNRRIEGKRYDETIRPNDIVHIELDAGDGKGLRSRMIGLVDRVARQVSVNPDQSVTRRVNIMGMDFGKMLLRHNCVKDIQPMIGTPGPAKAARLAEGMIFSGTPREITQTIFDTLLIKQLRWVEPYMKFSSPDADGDRDSWETYDETILETTGSVWAALKRSANEPFNAMTTETHGGVLHVIIEKYPFHAKTGKLTREPLHAISDDHIREENIGVDDSDRVTYVWHRVNAVTIYNQGANFTYMYPDLVQYEKEMIERHGFIPFYPESNFVPPGYIPKDQAEKSHKDLIAERTNEFWERNRRNHEYEMGSITIKGNPDIKAGDGVHVASTDMEYFVESYTERYVWGQDYQTTLNVTRGQKHGA
jgi:hypothetical protein